jgi:hypothetical protein
MQTDLILIGICSDSAQNLVGLGSVRSDQNLVKKNGPITAIWYHKNSEWILIRSAQIWWVSDKISVSLLIMD